MKKPIAILSYAVIGLVICCAIMGIGPLLTTQQMTLYIHIIGGPLAYMFLSVSYFKSYNFTTLLETALIFICFIIMVDFFLLLLYY